MLRWHTRGGEHYCPEHDSENLPVCLGCRQLLSHARVAASLDDGRFACENCHQRSVDDIGVARHLYEEVVAFFGTEFGLLMPEGGRLPDIELLDRNALLAKMTSRLARGGGAQCCPLGLTCTQEQFCTRTGKVVPSSRRISSLSIVTHLPAELCAATLAHEAGHVYLHLKGVDEAGPRKLRARVAEGLCELFSYLWEQSRGKDGDDVARRRRLSAMETSADAVYGVGLRDALAAYKACGSSLNVLLQRVHESGGTLPKADSPMVDIWADRTGRGWQGRAGAFRAVGEAPRAETRERARAWDEARRQPRKGDECEPCAD